MEIHFCFYFFFDGLFKICDGIYKLHGVKLYIFVYFLSQKYLKKYNLITKRFSRKKSGSTYCAFCRHIRIDISFQICWHFHHNHRNWTIYTCCHWHRNNTWVWELCIVLVLVQVHMVHLKELERIYFLCMSMFLFMCMTDEANSPIATSPYLFTKIYNSLKFWLCFTHIFFFK